MLAVYMGWLRGGLCGLDLYTERGEAVSLRKAQSDFFEGLAEIGWPIRVT